MIYIGAALTVIAILLISINKHVKDVSVAINTMMQIAVLERYGEDE